MRSPGVAKKKNSAGNSTPKEGERPKFPISTLAKEREDRIRANKIVGLAERASRVGADGLNLFNRVGLEKMKKIASVNPDYHDDPDMIYEMEKIDTQVE